MRFVQIILIACLGLFSLPAISQLQTIGGFSQYDIYYVDIDGNGTTDIYFQGGKKYIPIIHSDIFFPMVTGIKSYAVLNQGGQYQNAELMELSSGDLVGATLASSGTDYFSGDVNGDGIPDLLLRGENSSATGVSLLGTSELPQAGQALTSSTLAGANINDRAVNITLLDVNDDGRADITIDENNTGSANIAYLADNAGEFNNGSYLEAGTIIAEIPAYTGTSAGNFRVTETGAASYTIDLILPAGTAGVAPTLAFNYISSGSNGLLGKGWSLSGLSTVTRCRQTLGIDGAAQRLQWNQNDRFCLDGQRLILVSGTYGAPGSEYRTELDNYSMIKAVGGSTGHPDHFKVLRKDGSVTFYGQTSDSRQNPGSGVLAWAQSRFEDSVGNAVDYIYLNDANGHRVSAIQYAFGSSSYNAEVVFNYEGRPDPIKGYMAGHLLATTVRLSSVDIKNKENSTWATVRSYNLNYKPDNNSVVGEKTSLVSNIQECVSSGCLPPTIFDWSGTNTLGSFAGATTISTYDRLYDHVIDRRFLDINGDGLQDMVVLNQDDSYRYDHRFLLRSFISDGNQLTPVNFHGIGHWFEFIDDPDNEIVKIETLDYNGDGRQDLALYRSVVGYWQVFISVPVNNDWILSGSPINLTHLDSEQYAFADMNADGLQDAISLDKIYYLEPAANGSIVTPYAFQSPVSMGALSFGPPASSYSDESCGDNQIGYYPRSVKYEFHGGTGDINGDGNLELIARYISYCSQGNGSTYQIEAIVEKQGNQFAPHLIYNGGTRSALQLTDINGDGLSDLLIKSYAYGTERHWNVRLSNGNVFGPEMYLGRLDVVAYPQTIDLDGDGNQEFVYHNDHTHQMIYNRFNGTGFEGERLLIGTNGSTVDSRSFADINADNQPDYIRQDRYNLHIQMANSQQEPEKTITKITNGLGAETELHYQTIAVSDAYTTVDHELSYRYYSNFNYEAVGARPAPCGVTSCSNQLNITAEEKAEFEQIQQGELALGVLDLPAGTQTMGTTQPVLPINGALYVVTKVYSSAPEAELTPGEVAQSAKSGVAYQYAGARMQAAGRGFLGFQYLKTIDLQTNIKTTTLYRQDYPFIGAALKTVTFSPDGKVMQESENDWGYVERNGADGTKYYQTLMNASSDIGYKTVASGVSNNGNTPEYTGGLTAAATKIKSVDTSYSYDAHGNPTQIIVETKGYDNAGSNNLTQIKTTNNSYSADTLTITEWGTPVSYAEMGRLTAASVITDLDGNTTTRDTSFTYHNSGALAGLLLTETVQPGAAADQTLTTTHSYDSFGNETGVTTTGWDGYTTVDRTATSQYDLTGRYVDKTFNAYGQTVSQVLARDVRGTPSHTVNLSGIETTITTDGLGRETYRSDTTGAWVQTEYLNCNSGCPSGAKYGTKTIVAGGGESVKYFDLVGRQIREGSLNFSGNWVYKDTLYDLLGRVVHQSEPFYSLIAPKWSTFQYDALGRNWHTQAPDGSLNIMAYDGFQITITNAFNQQKIETKNALDQLVSVEDHLGGRIGYDYNIDGELTAMHSYRSGGALAASTSLTYDALGRKTSMTDPDKGYWQYTYNAFGELVEQTDANNQRVENHYDVLGRLIKRTDYKAGNIVEGHTTWVYDNNTRTGIELDNARGQLREIILSEDVTHESCFSASTQQCNTTTYDDYGRVSITEVKLGAGGSLGTYRTMVDYDSIGRVVRGYDALDSTVQHNGSAITSGTETDYNSYGFPYRTTDLQTGNTLQEIVSRDERGNVTEEIKGNGVRSYYQYDAETGRMLQQNSSLVGLFAVQDISYDWDVLGNLIYRHNQSATDNHGSQKDLQESFCYDGLNRLIKTNSGTTVNTACSSLVEADQDMRYDSLGNITYKHDVGDYTYASVNNTSAAGDAGVHAVTSTSDGYTYHYDNNGNMIEDRKNGVVERTLQYTSFDKPDEITKGNHTTRFAYGHDRSRYWREDTDANGVVTTTLYLGGVERISKSNSTNIEWKRYLGHSIVTLTTDANNNQISSTDRYVYKDHLGSTDLITDGAGQIIQSMSFDAWGQRRNPADWQPLTSLALTNFDASESTKGFTGHEHLDEVGLIHMNGRIYDPRLARFLQADPHIQAPNDTQMLNRYSYVRNNPLNATDPSGYFLAFIVGFIAKALGAKLWAAALMTGIAATAQAIASGAGFGDALKAGVIAGLSAYAFGKVGEHYSELGNANAASEAVVENYYSFGGNMLTSGQITQQIALHGLVGGVSASLQGGKFGHGFVGAGFTKGIMGAANFDSNPTLGEAAGQSVVAAIVGGSASELTGGKFRNGAQTAAIGHLFNYLGMMFGHQNQQSLRAQAALQDGCSKSPQGCASGLGDSSELANIAKELPEIVVYRNVNGNLTPGSGGGLETGTYYNILENKSGPYTAYANTDGFDFDVSGAVGINWSGQFFGTQSTINIDLGVFSLDLLFETNTTNLNGFEIGAGPPLLPSYSVGTETTFEDR